jgi:hypothetical protein
MNPNIFQPTRNLGITGGIKTKYYNLIVLSKEDEDVTASNEKLH